MTGSLLRPEIREADVDVMLERRLTQDPTFADAFVAAALSRGGRTVRFDTVRVTRQAPHVGTTGTIDLLVTLIAGDRMAGRLLMENKIDSGFTPDQPERYATSAVALSAPGHPAVAVLCAPDGYLRRTRHAGPFGARISYEEMAGWLDGSDYHAVRTAIDRFEMPYEPDPVPEVGEFHDGYRQLAATVVPELVVKRGPNSNDVRPQGSFTIYFDVRRTLPSYPFLPTMRFSHQCQDKGAASASVKVMLAGWGRFASTLRREAVRDLPSPVYLRPAGDSLGIVVDTPRLDNKRPVARQREAVMTGLRAAAMLRGWMFANEEALQRWAEVVRSFAGVNGA